MKKPFILFILSIFSLWVSCQYIPHTPDKNIQPTQEVITEHRMMYKEYQWTPESALIDRVISAPPATLTFLQTFDGRPDYTPYIPDKQEMELIRQYLELLPPGLKNFLKDHLVAIHFINGFLGSGLTDLLFDEKGRMYTYITLTPDTLKDSLNERITYRETSSFIPDNSGMSIEVRSSKDYRGLLYVLLHETVHCYDYVMRTTPYIEDFIKDYAGINNMPIHRSTPFTHNIWSDIRQPVSKYDFKQRSRLTFYGFGGGPKFTYTEAPELYKQLSRTPFPSLYGAKNWAEDLADMLTFYHITQVMKLDYTIFVLSNQKPVHTYAPYENPLIKRRFKTLKSFY